MIVEKETGLRFEGDLCLVRFNAANQPTMVLFCRGKSLRVGDFVVRAKSDEVNFEIDLNKRDAPIVAGPASAVDFIEIRHSRIWPK